MPSLSFASFQPNAPVEEKIRLGLLVLLLFNGENSFRFSLPTLLVLLLFNLTYFFITRWVMTLSFASFQQKYNTKTIA